MKKILFTFMMAAVLMILSACGEKDSIIDYHNDFLSERLERVYGYINNVEAQLMVADENDFESFQQIFDVAASGIETLLIEAEQEDFSDEPEPVQDLHAKYTSVVTAAHDFTVTGSAIIELEGEEDESTYNNYLEATNRFVQENEELSQMIDDYVEEYDLEFEDLEE